MMITFLISIQIRNKRSIFVFRLRFRSRSRFSVNVNFNDFPLWISIFFSLCLNRFKRSLFVVLVVETEIQSNLDLFMACEIKTKIDICFTFCNAVHSYTRYTRYTRCTNGLLFLSVFFSHFINFHEHELFQIWDGSWMLEKYQMCYVVQWLLTAMCNEMWIKQSGERWKKKKHKTGWSSSDFWF